ncbi:hypothetical protein SLEP1_g13680 [Rubroshorea leprosula]|uniref:Uncharacterized protein n=1 Tax=Rubroshorea leprosula TaxID=152421 RepID=A0AAV5IMR8_9ROSI|nr:hypothetical protein SLEP1_g13680 [Rubroshorea leprosula]
MVTHDRVRAEVLAHLDRTEIGLARMKFASSPIASVPRDLNNGDGTEAQVSKYD